MKLIEAVRIANAPQNGAAFHVLLACGFTPLFLETAVKRICARGCRKNCAHSYRPVRRSGPYSRMTTELLDTAFVVIEWEMLSQARMA